MQQLMMGVVADRRTAELWEELHEAVKDAARLITPKELCFRLGITAQYLSDALGGKNSKGFRLEWLVDVLDMAPLESVERIMRVLGKIRGFEPVRKKVLTPEQKLDAVFDRLKVLAPGLLAMLEKEIGG